MKKFRERIPISLWAFWRRCLLQEFERMGVALQMKVIGESGGNESMQPDQHSVCGHPTWFVHEVQGMDGIGGEYAWPERWEGEDP